MFGGGVIVKKISFLVMMTIGISSAYAQISSAESVQADGFYHADQNGIEQSDHDALARYYENIAKAMQEKLLEEKKLLQKYDNHSYYYGRKGQELQFHTVANIRHYEKSIKENLKEAAIHQKMAKDAMERHDADVDGQFAVHK